MPLERFVDTITEHISLRIKKDPVDPRVDYISSYAFDSFHYVPLAATYISNAKKVHLSPQRNVFVPFLHSYGGLTASAYLGNPNVLNIIGLNIKPYTLERKPSYSFKSSEYLLNYDKAFPGTNYLENNAHNIYSSETSIHILSSEDFLNFDYRKQRNFITTEEISFEDPSNSNGGGGNNNTNSLKEFWA